jgi:hypothetical protein
VLPWSPSSVSFPSASPPAARAWTPPPRRPPPRRRRTKRPSPTSSSPSRSSRRTPPTRTTPTTPTSIRYAANKARQKLEVSSADATKDLQGALRVVTTACADAVEVDMLAKCRDAVKALDASLDKTGAAAAALGVAGKYPRVAPDAVTDEARTQIASFLKARGPGAAEKAYIDKRNDAKASPTDVIAACEAAQGDASAAAMTFEKADEPIRLVGVTRKMAMDSQCRRLGELDALSKDLTGCKKKAKSTECKIVCGKVKTWLDDGLPAAAFTPIQKDYGDICDKG